ncbi:hypothetical protein T12_15979 [Trichinella patagoniensis]|uniref:Uncharacterized protein n=1 Tax=Trichinella patagoniensis TaxID=990121 RepID=A0A0V0YRV0_9BILA|nr:hypothetical protein T12_15979 [Trichinella patagoniensis]
MYHHQTVILAQNSTTFLQLSAKESSSLQRRIAETQFHASCKLLPLGRWFQLLSLISD